MNILLIEDEERLADFVRRGLKGEGWNVEHVPDGETGLERLRQHEYEVVILDLMLPGISGQDVCRRMRARDIRTPVLMLSALDRMDERVAGLRIGADDYLAKPFDFEELLARLHALWRRHALYNDDHSVHQRLDPCGLHYDTDAMKLTIDGEDVKLSVKERDLLVLFLTNENKVLSRERILNVVWGSQEDPLTNVVDVYVGRVRRKLGAYGRWLTTIRGVGYRYERAD
ncbi:MAG: response regulator transcription factor [Pseudomonadota bacterium]